MMRNPSRKLASILPAALLLLVCCHRGIAAEQVDSLARLAPPDSILFAELERPEVLIDLALSPQLEENLRKIDAYREFYQSQQWRQLNAVVAMMEAKLQTGWQQAVRSLTGGGAALAFDPQSQALVALVRSKDAGLLARLTSTVEEMVQQDAANNGRESRIRRKQYKGVEVVSFGPQEYHAILGDVLAVSNKSEAMQQVIDRHASADVPALAANATYKSARAGVEGEPVAWAMLNVTPLRGLPPVQNLLSNKADNPVLPLLLGDLVENLRHSSHVTAALHKDGGTLNLRFCSPHDPANAPDTIAGLFPSSPAESALPPLRPKGAILSLSTYRDLGALWLAREELLQEQAAAQLAQVDTGLGQFFAGKEFGTEVLGEVAPQLQLVVTRQQFDDGRPVPGLKLPAFAAVLKLNNPKQFGQTLLIAYQKIVGLVNLVGGNAGQPQLLQTNETYRDATLYKAEYLPPTGDTATAPINYNFSPAIAQVGDRFIISSTVALARELIDTLAGDQPSPSASNHTLLELDISQLIAILRDNRESLISQNMLQQSNTREQAEAIVDGLLNAAAVLEGASLRLATETDKMVLELAVETGL